VSNETRERILDAAWALVRERGPGAVTVADIAAAAGVSRQLVYFHFANRAGLLVAMTRHQDTRSGFRTRAFATRDLPPAEAFTALVTAWHEYLPEILPVALDLEAAAITGEDGAEAWRDRMGELHEALRLAVERLAAAELLAPGWDVDEAADWAWARCQPPAWRHLVGERAWKPEEYVRRTVAAIVGEIVTSRSPNV
jgi:AcrR family transcriptional regulator